MCGGGHGSGDHDGSDGIHVERGYCKMSQHWSCLSG